MSLSSDHLLNFGGVPGAGRMLLRTHFGYQTAAWFYLATPVYILASSLQDQCRTLHCLTPVSLHCSSGAAFPSCMQEHVYTFTSVGMGLHSCTRPGHHFLHPHRGPLMPEALGSPACSAVLHVFPLIFSGITLNCSLYFTSVVFSARKTSSLTLSWWSWGSMDPTGTPLLEHIPQWL